MVRKILGYALLAIVVGCATGGGSGPSGEGAGRGEFGTEGRSDPGLEGARTGSTGVEVSSADFRTLYFNFDESALREEAKRDLRHNAQVLREQTKVRIEIQGNCDERGAAEYNLALGMRRAEVAKRYLVDLGIDARRVTTISFGEENPAVRGHSEAAWAKNRRDDFVVR